MKFFCSQNPKNYSKNCQSIATSKNTSNVLIATCWTPCKKRHLSRWSNSTHFFSNTLCDNDFLPQLTSPFLLFLARYNDFSMKNLSKSILLRTDGPTDGPTDRQPNTRSYTLTAYSDARMHRKRKFQTYCHFYWNDKGDRRFWNHPKRFYVREINSSVTRIIVKL